MSAWHVVLKGDSVTLERLAQSLNLPELNVQIMGDEVCLASTRFEQLTEPHGVYTLAEDIIEKVNSVYALKYSEALPVYLDTVVRLNPDGSKDRRVFLSGGSTATVRVAARLVVIGTDGVESTDDTSPMQIALNELMKGNANLEDALRYFQNPTWVNLYKVFEVVHSDNVGRQELLCCVSDTDLDRFKRTAQNPNLVGDLARHGRFDKAPPKKPMTLDEARALWRLVLGQWIEALSNLGKLRVPS